MKRKKIILIVILLAVIGTGIFIASEMLSYKHVEFAFKDGTYDVEVFQGDNNNSIARFSSTKTLSLKPGTYSYKVLGDGDMYSDTPISFEVSDTNDKQIITVTPWYSDSYLSKQLQEQHDAITHIITNTFAPLNILYTIESLSLDQTTKWAYGTLAVKGNPKDLPDFYRFVLHKKNNNWEVVVPPQIVIQRSAYPTVPEAVLNALY